MSKPMTKKEWQGFIKETWNDAQKKAWCQSATEKFVSIPCNLLPRIEHFIAEAIETMEVAGVIIKPDAHQLLADVQAAAHGIK